MEAAKDSLPAYMKTEMYNKKAYANEVEGVYNLCLKSKGLEK
jgi:hypothetical protein